ncbi:PREDICTED: proclotting enzyme-like [Vollenhovia emeryi]|uniref:proclotting enzyme-like n=1 Tax=Vollenhovia emeryi TaxID=411798 RepID=UPI0005F48FE0|nr:PREDICTED: proclotting enzyme-like [Vollenhovia emeryi]
MFVTELREMANCKICILIALLPQLLYTLVQGQQSPCPQYFTYITKPGTNETIGHIEIQSPPKTDEIHMRVTLKVAAELPTRYVGRLELARSKEESAQAVQQGRHLSYHIHFPLRDPIPTLSGMWFNGAQYCSGSNPTGSIITTITLEHTLYLPNFAPNPNVNLRPTPIPPRQHNTQKNPFTTGVTLSEEEINKNVFLRPGPSQSPPRYTNIFLNNNSNIFRPTTPVILTRKINSNSNTNKNMFFTPFSWTTTVKPTRHYNNNNNNNNYNECGISGHSGATNLLIANGEKTLPGQWPWLVALFVVKKGYEFQCAGSVLTTKHVLTAAHCLKLSLTNNDTILPNLLEVALGRFHLRQFREKGTVNREIASYKIHPDYVHAATGDSDLAILTLRMPVEFSAFIKPICLWSKSTDLQDIHNKVGYVVGWGQDEHGNRYTEEPRMATMPIVSQVRTFTRFGFPRSVNFAITSIYKSNFSIESEIL